MFCSRTQRSDAGEVINEMIKCVPMLILRKIRDFRKLLFNSLFHIVNLVAL